VHPVLGLVKCALYAQFYAWSCVLYSVHLVLGLVRRELTVLGLVRDDIFNF
jgi:hypothetical protein